MDDSLLLTSSRAGLNDLPLVPSLLTTRIPARSAAQPPQNPDVNSLVDVLRQALADRTRSNEAILRASTDAARVLTGAEGTALALRTNGAVVCRARSGPIAPELGSTINVASGISGECLRTATIMVCEDAATDPRVDAEVCLALGIRSILVVPLRGSMGIAGILEAFSGRPQAFGTEQIDLLRSLAEVIETAYARSVAIEKKPAEKRAGLFGAQSGKAALETSVGQRPETAAKAQEIHAGKFPDEYPAKRRYWIPVAVIVALLLVSLVAWWSWNASTAETQASETAHAASVTGDHPGTSAEPASLRLLPLKPDAGVARRQAERLLNKGVVQNAAEIESTGTDGASGSGVALAGNAAPLNAESKSSGRTTAEETVSSPPPLVVVSPSAPPANVTSDLGAAPMPAFGAPVSTGVTEAALIRRVEPTYPAEAKMQRVAGAVVLDTTIGADGTVRQLDVVSGPSLLTSSAVEAVKRWRYTPSLLNGKPIEVQKRITILFKLP